MTNSASPFVHRLEPVVSCSICLPRTGKMPSDKQPRSLCLLKRRRNEQRPAHLHFG